MPQLKNMNDHNDETEQYCFINNNEISKKKIFNQDKERSFMRKN